MPADNFKIPNYKCYSNDPLFVRERGVAPIIGHEDTYKTTNLEKAAVDILKAKYTEIKLIAAYNSSRTPIRKSPTNI